MIQPMPCSAQTIHHSQTIPGDEISQNMVIFCSRYSLCILFKAASNVLSTSQMMPTTLYYSLQ